MQLKKLIELYENSDKAIVIKSEEQPYIVTESFEIRKTYKYNPNFGDDRECKFEQNVHEKFSEL